MGERATDRTVIAVLGKDRSEFLQGLVSNDLRKLKDGPCYAALLTPQGKYLADFFLIEDADRIIVDIKSILADGFLRRLAMYKLRADVVLEKTDLHVLRGLTNPPEGAWRDPRDTALGWRLITPDDGDEPLIDWDEIRVDRCIPETGIELTPDDTYILEAGFERLSGVDFRKGCYVGQEVTARMKHK
ncbi:MAG: folate-binding protein, partial [Paracoccaceae bacterium]|nr:folate-binding protein [Paracoccaceae bacterium]